MTDESIKVRLNNLEEQIGKFAKRSSKNSNKAELDIDKNNIELAKTNGDLGAANESLEETAITVADFLAEYYLSQLGIDDFDMEGGEEE